MVFVGVASFHGIAFHADGRIPSSHPANPLTSLSVPDLIPGFIHWLIQAPLVSLETRIGDSDPDIWFWGTSHADGGTARSLH